MKSKTGKVALTELSVAWETLLTLKGISREFEHRIRRMVSRATPLTDQVFLKTVKGREMIAECAKKTRLVREALNSQGDDVYRVLTDLERTYEDFLKRVYEFRVKAG